MFKTNNKCHQLSNEQHKTYFDGPQMTGVNYKYKV